MHLLNPFTNIHDENFRRHTSMYVTIHDGNFRKLYYIYTRIPGSWYALRSGSFRKGHSTELASIELIDIITQDLDKDKIPISIF